MKAITVLSVLILTAFAGCTSTPTSDDATVNSIDAIDESTIEDYNFEDQGQLVGPALKRWAWEVKADTLTEYEIRIDLNSAQGAPVFASTNVRIQVWDSEGELRSDYSAPADAGQTKDVVFFKASETERMPTGVWTAELQIDAGALDYGLDIDIDY